MTQIEIVAAIFGFLCVYFYIVRNVWSWPTGLVQVVLYIAVFWKAKLYADMSLHVVYVVLQLYGWWAWLQSTTTPSADTPGPVELDRPANTPKISVRSLSIWENVASVAATLIMTATFTWLLSNLTDADMPIPDSFVAATSLVAQYLLAARFLQNWIYWIIVNSVGIVLFAYKELYPTAVLYALFWVMAVIGYASWTKEFRNQNVNVGE